MEIIYLCHSETLLEGGTEYDVYGTCEQKTFTLWHDEL